VIAGKEDNEGSGVLEVLLTVIDFPIGRRQFEMRWWLTYLQGKHQLYSFYVQKRGFLGCVQKLVIFQPTQKNFPPTPKCYSPSYLLSSAQISER
jgi:hypothetical protein